MNKRDKLDFFPTSCHYEAEENISNQNAPVNPFFTENNMVNESFKQNVLKKPTQEDWLECHQLFLKFVNKANEIKMKELF